MFNTAKTLIVVYKDELILNQLKKLVETKDDTESKIVGSKDGSINIVAWTEKVWLSNKKPGNIQGKILFLGDIKDTDKLIPVLDEKFNDYGVKFGWAGNQAVLYTDSKILSKRELYCEFVEQLQSLAIPEKYKEAKNTNLNKFNDFEEKKDTNDSSKSNLLIKAKEQLAKSVNQLETASLQVAMKAEDHLRDKKYVNTQMLLYGVVTLYNDELEKFMNS